MKYICNYCNHKFISKIEPTECPHCKSTNIELAINKSIESMINRYNELAVEMKELMDKYTPLYLETYCINNILRVYKRRGLITEEEIPKFEKPKLEAQVAEYRKAKRESKKGE